MNRPVLDFDEFMKIPVRTHLDIIPATRGLLMRQGCTKGQHTSVIPKQEPPKPQTTSIPAATENKPPQATPSAAPAPIARARAPESTPAPSPPPEEEEEEDDLTAEVPVGTTCRHKGCGKTFVSNEASRLGDGDEAVCTYHPKSVSVLCISSIYSLNIWFSPSSTKVARYALVNSLLTVSELTNNRDTCAASVVC